MSRSSIALFAAAIFASSLLLFLVQPMVGKHILPWFGGTPGVWLLCLTFYQSCLFAGYAYAHFLISRVQISRQLPVHLALLVTALVTLPVLPEASWKPMGEGAPSALILSMLAANVGFPFLALAASGPLLQAWFARAFPSRSPYGLFAVSNAGSLLALLAYPFWVEPAMGLPSQSNLWSWGFAACGLAVLGCGWLAVRGGGAAANPAAARLEAAASAASAGRDRLLPFWIGLAACAVVLLMGVTNELCLDVANIPFLWIGPLAIYLLTFILCFASERFYRRDVFIPLAAVALAAAVGLRLSTVGTLDVAGPGLPIWLIASADLFVLFTHCMLLHGELYRLRPPAERLTRFYLCISGGGAAGGLFVALAAPLIFSDYHELRLGLVACWLLVSWLCLGGSETRLASSQQRRGFGAAVSLGSVALVALVIGSGRPDSGGELLYQERNFFGVLRVTEYGGDDPEQNLMILRHGTTNHGSQTLNPKFRDRPVSYFAHSTGIGFVMQKRPPARMRVGIIGLGAGTLAAYGRAGDHFRFYEIDPNVIEVAQNTEYFSYLSRSKAEVEIVYGDARLSLERELEEGKGQGFHLLVLDAFSSDAIPVHLLTVEAFAIYLRHLDRDGILAVHITNQNVELAPLLFRVAAEFDLLAVQIVNQQFLRHLHSRANWMILGRDSRFIGDFRNLVEKRRVELNLKPGGLFAYYPDPMIEFAAPRWTDDYSDLLSVIKTQALSGAELLREKAARQSRGS